MANIVVEHLVQQAENLPLSDYLELIEQLVHRLRDKLDTQSVQHDWQELYGRGKGVWTEDESCRFALKP